MKGSSAMITAMTLVLFLLLFGYPISSASLFPVVQDDSNLLSGSHQMPSKKLENPGYRLEAGPFQRTMPLRSPRKFPSPPPPPATGVTRTTIHFPSPPPPAKAPKSHEHKKNYKSSKNCYHHSAPPPVT